MSAKLKVCLSGLLLLAGSVVAWNQGEVWHFIACAGLGFSFFGDALLANYLPISGKIRDPFIPGMASFAVAQSMYMWAFRRSMSAMPLRYMRVPGGIFGGEVLPGLLLVYCLAGVLFWVVVVLRSSQPRELRFATLFYALLVCAMAAHATAAAFTGKVFAWPLLYGALLFVISDGAIAMHIFGGRLENERTYELFVWATYLPAQILLLLGVSWLY